MKGNVGIRVLHTEVYFGGEGASNGQVVVSAIGRGGKGGWPSIQTKPRGRGMKAHRVGPHACSGGLSAAHRKEF